MSLLSVWIIFRSKNRIIHEDMITWHNIYIKIMLSYLQNMNNVVLFISTIIILYIFYICELCVSVDILLTYYTLHMWVTCKCWHLTNLLYFTYVSYVQALTSCSLIILNICELCASVDILLTYYTLHMWVMCKCWHLTHLLYFTYVSYV